MSEVMIGIDFGTTTSSMAWVDPATGKASLVAPADPDSFTNPSYDLWNARIALSDAAEPMPGDLEGVIRSVTVGSQRIKLLIDTVRQ